MSFLSLIGLATAYADTPVTSAQPHQGGGILSILPMLLIFVAIFYFFMIRPQSKRARELKSLMDSLTVGDEVVTSGGIIGKISSIKDNFVVLSVSKGSEVVIQKNAISSVLPKGTIESL